MRRQKDVFFSPSFKMTFCGGKKKVFDTQQQKKAEVLLIGCRVRALFGDDDANDDDEEGEEDEDRRRRQYWRRHHHNSPIIERRNGTAFSRENTTGGWL